MDTVRTQSEQARRPSFGRGFTAFVLIAYNGILDLPGDGPAEVGVSKDWGYWVALLASAGIAAAGIGRSMEEQQGGAGARKPPGSV